MCKERHAIVGIYIRDSDKGMAYATYCVIVLRKMHKQRYMQFSMSCSKILSRRETQPPL